MSSLSDLAAPGPWHRLGLVPRSLKNRRRPVIAGGRALLVPSREAASDAKAIRAMLEAEGVRPLEKPMNVRLELRWLVESDAIEWRLVPLAAVPKGCRIGRQDLQGVVEALCDAIQGLQVENDSQVAEIRAVKVFGHDDG